LMEYELVNCSAPHGDRQYCLEQVNAIVLSKQRSIARS
jgi:hypothetical protein